MGPCLACQEGQHQQELGDRRDPGKEATMHSKPAQYKTFTQCLIILLFLMLFHFPALDKVTSYAPQQLTQQVTYQTEESVWSVYSLQPPGTWWPALTPNFCHLAAGLENWDIPTIGTDEITASIGRGNHLFGCSNWITLCELAQFDFYFCPREWQP